jgi:hypothetical protein
MIRQVVDVVDMVDVSPALRGGIAGEGHSYRGGWKQTHHVHHIHHSLHAGINRYFQPEIWSADDEDLP